nr:transcription repressor KAN1-like [Ipomoea batatas]
MSKQSSPERNQQLRPSSMAENPLLSSSSSSRVIKWTPDLHRRFLNAVEFLGGEQSATPKAIMDLMKEKDLTLSQVAGHLQMYRSFCFAQQQATRAEAIVATAAAQMGLTGNGGYSWSAPIHYQQAWPQPSPPMMRLLLARTFDRNKWWIYRMMDFSTTQQETILFEGVFQECRKRPIVGVDDEVDDENVRLELTLGDSTTKKPKIDLTLTL